MRIVARRWQLVLSALIILLTTAVFACSGAASAAPRGEIWEWALGRNAFTDPDLAPYTQGLGRTATCDYGSCGSFTSTEVVELADGFKLIPGADSTIRTVELYTSDGQFQAYPGRLPVGLDWGMTGADVAAMYGDSFNFVPDSTHFNPVAFRGVSGDGRYLIEIDFAVFNPAQVPGAPLHKIAVSPGPNFY